MTFLNNTSLAKDFLFPQNTPSPTVSLSGFPGVDDSYTVPPNSPSLDGINENMPVIEKWRAAIGAKRPTCAFVC